MKLLVGLGNPGAQYETTRHNAGFLILDQIAEQFGLSWGKAGRVKGLVATGRLWDERVILLKPQTFMNLSGQATVSCLSYYKADVADMVVFHDDVDISHGRVKARQGGGHGGHNGVRSIIELTGRRDFGRIKLGVGRDQEERQSTSDWVLNRFSDDELLSLHDSMYPEVLVRLKSIFDSKKAS